MNSLASSTRALRSTGHSFLALPPTCRLALYEQTLRTSSAPTRRAFSATASRKSELYNAVVSVPATLLDVIHSTGLPWFATIPTAAILVRGVLIYYAFTKPHRIGDVKMSHLAPLYSARRASKMRLLGRPPRVTTFNNISGKLQHWYKANKMSWAIRNQIQKAFGISGSLRSGIVTNLSLVVMSEAIRLRCGSSQGLVSILLYPFARVWTGIKRTFLDIKDQLSPISPDAPTPLVEQMESLSIVQSPFVDPSLMVEGLRWCPDLSVPDPYQLLPFFLTTIMIYQGVVTAMQIPVTRRPDLAGLSDAKIEAQAHQLRFDLKEHATQASKRKRSIFVNSSVAFIFGLIMTEVPAGIVLYLLTSVTTAGVQRLWLQYKYPAGEAITRCKLPMRVRVRNQYRK
ncbi:uncharacterized protein K489DRAFT_54485 [Dissoconium aciculare CBS 342.82]|uniref:Uncharacterized protein n=1 Tax=Dissoconium aciculare CBS 342.82 TaxID=1314786 RepID=A0A6J3LX82_9PEZI|nr:uncharacterized protein K489DRAFT_54485 [Dissoconium aciculare CBS 342.82]KAF1820361.1 hypothetical protein K489DRAFT_54485 [Dissoconium aciculare CBS 342.82]